MTNYAIFFCCEYVVVLFRVITVYPDLKPFTQEINVTITVSVFLHILSSRGLSYSHSSIYLLLLQYFVLSNVAQFYSLMWCGCGRERRTCDREVSASTPGHSTFM